MRINIYTDIAGEHRWRLTADNGQIVADSGEGYKNESDALDMINKIADAFANGTVDLSQDNDSVD